MMLGTILAALGGLALGAVVNWLADRLPAMRMTPTGAHEGDTAPAEAPTRPRRLRRYAAVEVLLAAVAVYLWVRYGPSARFGILLFYMALFTLIAVIDIEHRLVLNVVMFPAFAVALLEVLLSGRLVPLNGLAGYAVAQIIVMGFFLLGQVYLWAVNARRGGQPVTEVAFGFGDVTLATFCGLIVGYPGVMLMLVLMVLLGGLFALLYLVVQALAAREYRAHTPLPYGPSIILAASMLLLWGKDIARLLGA